MNDSITFLQNIQTGFKKMKLITVLSVVSATIVSIAAVGAAFWFAENQRSQVYIVDEGSVLMASRTSNSAQRDLEVGDQLKTFLRLFFNIAPNMTTIESNISMALELADASASNYYTDLQEKQYFSRIVESGISQSIEVDSVKVNVLTYPYQAEAYGHLYTVRSSNASRVSYVATCTATESQRTPKNAHGILLERFMIRFGESETRSRNN